MLPNHHVTPGMFLSRRPKQSSGGVIVHGAWLIPHLFAFRFLICRGLISAHVLLGRDLPAFAMICLVRHLCDPDATSAP